MKRNEHLNKPYRFIDRIKAIDAEILLQIRKAVLYRANGRLYLAVAAKRGHKKEFIYRLDDTQQVVNTIMVTLVDCVAWHLQIDSLLRLRTGSDKSYDVLMRRIIRDWLGIRILGRIELRSRQPKEDGAIDYRVGNAFFPDDPWQGFPPIVVDHYTNSDKFDCISIYDAKTSAETITDYDEDLFAICNRYCIYGGGGDGAQRMVVSVGEHRYLLYQMRLALEQFGSLPVEQDDLILAMEKYRSGLSPDDTIDHLNANFRDCRLGNLMIMLRQHNTKKSQLQRRLDALGRRYYFDAVRKTANTVSVSAGVRDDAGNTLAAVDDIEMEIADYLDCLERFVDLAESEEAFGVRKDSLVLDNPIYIVPSVSLTRPVSITALHDDGTCTVRPRSKSKIPPGSYRVEMGQICKRSLFRKHQKRYEADKAKCK